MLKMKNKGLALVLSLSTGLAIGGLALAQGFLTNGLPSATGNMTGNETLPLDTNLPSGQNPQSEKVNLRQLNAYLRSTGDGYYNAIIGGDFATNLWQRGTSIGSITTTALYTADRFFAWSGTSTTLSVAQSTTAAELNTGYTMGAKVSRTGTGVVQSCFAQVVESGMASAYQGATAELDFYAASGAGFSAAGSLLQVYIITGTVADEGSSKMAFGLNGGGGGSTAWTGQASTLAGSVSIGQSTLGRYVAVATIPAGTKEIGVALCWTPVGASPSNDFVTFSGIQLARNSGLSGQAGTVQSTAVAQASAFERRPAGLETTLQQRYYVSVSEPAASISVAPSGQGASTTTCVLSIPFPNPMRSAPTFAAIGTALSTSTWTVTHVVTNTALATPFLAATTGGSTATMGNLTATVASGLTAGQTCTLTGAAGGSILGFSAEL